MPKRLGLAMLVLAVLAASCKDKGELAIVSAEPSQLVAGQPTMVAIKGSGFEPGSKVWFRDSPSAQMIVVSGQRIIALPDREISSGVYMFCPTEKPIFR